MNRVVSAKPLALQQALAQHADLSQRRCQPSALPMAAVRDFQKQQLRARHGDHPVSNFFAEHLMGDLDLGGLEDNPEGSARRIQRLIRDTGSAAAAIEFSVLTDELSRAVAAELGDRPLTAINYARAYRSAGRRGDRQRQLGLIAFVAEDLVDVPRSRFAYAAFKLAKRPARAAGFAAVYDLLAAGFEAVRRDRQAEQHIAEWLATEQALMQRLLR